MQRLAEHYRELSDDELRDLAADFADLTENAQQALRTEMQTRGLRLAGADPLGQARAIAAQLIPRQVIQDAQTEIPDYQPPTCPKCGAPDPVLEGVDPTNSWRCEQCGQRWKGPISPDSTLP